MPDNRQSRPQSRPPILTALYIGLGYFFLSLLWIFFSDTVLAFLVRDIGVLSRIQTYKGIFFITASALVILWLIYCELERAEKISQELDRHQSQLDALLNSQIDFVCTYTPDTVLTYVNDAYCEFYGKTREDLIGTSYLDFTPDENIPAIKARIQEVLALRAPDVREFHVLDANGNTRWVQWVDQVVKDADGQVLIQAVGRDITTRKQLEDALRESERSFRLLFEHNPMPMYVFDMETLEFLEVNDVLIERYGYSRNELLSMKISDIRPPEEVTRLIDTLEDIETNLQEIYVSTDWRHTYKDGTVINVMIASDRIEFRGREASLVAAIDITEAKQAERQLKHINDLLDQRVRQRTADLEAANKELTRLGQAKDDFVSNVSHELATPITSLKVHMHILKHAPEGRVTRIDTLTRELDRLEHIVKSLLFLSRLDQDRIVVNRSAVDINAVLEEFAADRILIAQTKGLDLQTKLKPGLPPAAGDTQLIEQVASILLTNAFNYTPPGGRVSIETYMSDSEVCFSVADNGPGIPEEEQVQLFDRFFRGHAVDDLKTPGTGLGLAIAKEVMNKLDGRITFISTPGEGTTFKAHFPKAT